MRTGTAVHDLGSGPAPTEPLLLKISITMPERGTLLVTVRGELDLASAPELDAHVRHALGRWRPRRLLMDVSGLGFLGLHGTAVFERIRRRADRSGVGLSLVGLPAAGARALAYTGAVGRYDQYSDLAAALAATRPDTG